MLSLRTLEKGMFLAALALVACKKEETDTGDTGDTADTGVDTSPVYLEPYWFSVNAFFGYDAGTNKIVAYSGTSTDGDFTQSPAIAVTLTEAGPSDTSAGDDICTIIAEQAGPIDAITTFGGPDDGVDIGFTLDWDLATISSDCDGLVDPAIWGDGMSNIKGVVWGAGITAPIDTFLSSAIEDQVTADTSADWDADWAPFLLGSHPYFDTTGAIWNPDGNSASNPKEFYYAFGNAVDGDFKILVDGDGNTTPLLASDVGDGTVPTGAYGTQTAYLLNFGMPLAEGVLIPAAQ